MAPHGVMMTTVGSRHQIRPLASGPRRNAGELVGGGGDGGQGLLRVEVVLGRVRLEALEVDAQGRALGAGAREAHDGASATFEADADALLLRTRAVDRVGVGEVVGRDDGEAVRLRSRQAAEPGAQVVDEGGGGRGVDAFVVVPRIIVGL